MELKGIDKCRVILFLCYNFDDVMKIEGFAEKSAQIFVDGVLCWKGSVSNA